MPLSSCDQIGDFMFQPPNIGDVAGARADLTLLPPALRFSPVMVGDPDPYDLPSFYLAIIAFSHDYFSSSSSSSSHYYYYY